MFIAVCVLAASILIPASSVFADCIVTCAGTHLLQDSRLNGGDVFTLQQILGHSTLEIIRYYMDLAANHVMIQHQKFSPLNRLNLR